jgi:hypothetical protein
MRRKSEVWSHLSQVDYKGRESETAAPGPRACSAEKSSFLRRSSIDGRRPRARARAADRLNVTPARPVDDRVAAVREAAPPGPAAAAAADGSKSRLERPLWMYPPAPPPESAADPVSATLSRPAAVPETTLATSCDRCLGASTGSLFVAATPPAEARTP